MATSLLNILIQDALFRKQMMQLQEERKKYLEDIKNTAERIGELRVQDLATQESTLKAKQAIAAYQREIPILEKELGEMRRRVEDM